MSEDSSCNNHLFGNPDVHNLSEIFNEKARGYLPKAKRYGMAHSWLKDSKNPVIRFC